MGRERAPGNGAVNAKAQRFAQKIFRMYKKNVYR